MTTYRITPASEDELVLFVNDSGEFRPGQTTQGFQVVGFTTNYSSATPEVTWDDFIYKTPQPNVSGMHLVAAVAYAAPVDSVVLMEDSDD